MMNYAALCFLALAAVASAFAPVAAPVRTTALNGVQDMAGISKPLGFFDPAGYSSQVSDDALMWFRAAELKHSRVAMVACAGWITTAGLGFTFPGDISPTGGVSYASLGTKPVEAWAALPYAGKAQIIGVIAIIEFISEVSKPHYTKGGDFVRFDPLNLSGKMNADALKAKQTKELNNGRLAMIGAMSFSAAATIPGSVPALPLDF